MNLHPFSDTIKPEIVVGDFLMNTFFKNGPHNDVTPDHLVEMTLQNFQPQLVKPGYRDGVILVPLPTSNVDWTSNIVQLQNGDYLFGKFKARAGTEDPRKSITALATPDRLMPVLGVDAILYHRDVLAETEDCLWEDFDYEIVKVNIKVVFGEQPMPPETLIANHYGFSGGSNTKMSPEEFEKALRESAVFWRDKAYIHEGSQVKVEKVLKNYENKRLGIHNGTSAQINT